MEKNFLINIDNYQITTLSNSLKKITSKNPNLYALHCASLKDKKILKKTFYFIKNIYCFEEFYLENYKKIDINEFEMIEKSLGLTLDELDRSFQSYAKYYVHPILSSKKRIEMSKKRAILNYKFYSMIFDVFKPNIIIHEHSGGTGSKILWNLCEKFNCAYYFFKGLYFEKKFVFLDHKDFSYPFFDEKILKKYSKTEVEVFKNETLSVNKIAPYEKQAKLFQKVLLKKKFVNFFNKAKIYYSSTAEENYFYNRFPPILDNIIFYSYTKLRKFFFINFIEEKVSLNNKYVGVFLQVEPELSTYSLNNKKISFIDLISTLSKLLPDDYKIYVKEHPSQSINSRFRSLKFFKELKKIDNVKICPLNLDSIDFIKKSQFIATGGGTAVFECIMYNIPCLVFGKHFYFNFKSVFSIEEAKDISRAINKIKLYKATEKIEYDNLNFALNIRNSMLDGYLFLNDENNNEQQIKPNDELIFNSLNKFFELIK